MRGYAVLLVAAILLGCAVASQHTCGDIKSQYRTACCGHAPDALSGVTCRSPFASVVQAEHSMMYCTNVSCALVKPGAHGYAYTYHSHSGDLHCMQESEAAFAHAPRCDNDVDIYERDVQSGHRRSLDMLGVIRAHFNAFGDPSLPQLTHGGSAFMPQALRLKHRAWYGDKFLPQSDLGRSLQVFRTVASKTLRHAFDAAFVKTTKIPTGDEVEYSAPYAYTKESLGNVLRESCFGGWLMDRSVGEVAASALQYTTLHRYLHPAAGDEFVAKCDDTSDSLNFIVDHLIVNVTADLDIASRDDIRGTFRMENGVLVHSGNEDDRRLAALVYCLAMKEEVYHVALHIAEGVAQQVSIGNDNSETRERLLRSWPIEPMVSLYYSGALQDLIMNRVIFRDTIESLMPQIVTLSIAYTRALYDPCAHADLSDLFPVQRRMIKEGICLDGGILEGSIAQTLTSTTEAFRDYYGDVGDVNLAARRAALSTLHTDTFNWQRAWLRVMLEFPDQVFDTKVQPILLAGASVSLPPECREDLNAAMQPWATEAGVVGVGSMQEFRSQVADAVYETDYGPYRCSFSASECMTSTTWI